MIKDIVLWIGIGFIIGSTLYYWVIGCHNCQKV